jgi:hypothetical protein
MTKQIPLTQGKVALVDDDMYDYLMQWKWQAKRNRKSDLWYAYRSVWKGKPVFMHRAIMNAPAGFDVDHKDNNGLNNLRSNLRICTHAQNSINQQKHKNNTSGYKCVYPVRKRWCAKIRYNNKNVHLGMFDTPEDAARAYDAKAKELYGEFARTNF